MCPLRLNAASLRLISCALAGLIAVGCSRAPAPEQQEPANLRALAIVYGKYLTAQGRPPKNRDELIEYAETQGTDVLQHFRIDDPTRLTISPRTEEPMVIVTEAGTFEYDRIIAYESRAVDGTRKVVRLMGSVDDMEEADFSRLVPQATQGSSPPSGGP